MPHVEPNLIDIPRIVETELDVGDLSSPNVTGLGEDLPQVPASIVPHFPQRLKKNQDNSKTSEFLELFKQVKINIPILDAIKQVPAYSKFLKDLCTVKRKHNVKKNAYMAAYASSIILNETPPKYKDPVVLPLNASSGNTK